MNRLLIGLALYAAFATGCGTIEMEDLADASGGVLVATFNVHYLSARVPQMDWDLREQPVLDALRYVDADIIAFQEMETFEGERFNLTNRQLESVLDAFPGYRAAAVGDPREFPSTQPIVYRSASLRALDQGFFFFSDAPDRIYSRPWHGRYPAFASWGLFERVPGAQRFYVVNVHADASSPRNRMKTARLVVKRVGERSHPEVPVVLLGDFNAPAWFPSSGVYRRAGYSRTGATGATYHFNRGLHVIPAIDHIYATAGLQVTGAAVVRLRPDGVWPSDHYPVAARIFP